VELQQRAVEQRDAALRVAGHDAGLDVVEHGLQELLLVSPDLLHLPALGHVAHGHHRAQPGLLAAEHRLARSHQQPGRTALRPHHHLHVGEALPLQGTIQRDLLGLHGRRPVGAQQAVVLRPALGRDVLRRPTVEPDHLTVEHGHPSRGVAGDDARVDAVQHRHDQPPLAVELGGALLDAALQLLVGPDQVRLAAPARDDLPRLSSRVISAMGVPHRREARKATSSKSASGGVSRMP
jgi:hypothetical protein